MSTGINEGEGETEEEEEGRGYDDVTGCEGRGEEGRCACDFTQMRLAYTSASLGERCGCS